MRKFIRLRLRLLASALVGVCLGLQSGCSGQPEKKAPDPDAVKRELEELNKARQKEWKQ